MATWMIRTTWAPTTTTTKPRLRSGSGERKSFFFNQRKAPSGSGGGVGRVLATAARPAQEKELRKPRPQNVAGEFYVDHTCINCDTCRWMAPSNFVEAANMAAVYKQPTTKEERVQALQALISCPTRSIHTVTPPSDILQVHKTLPIPIDDHKIPLQRSLFALLRSSQLSHTILKRRFEDSREMIGTRILAIGNSDERKDIIAYILRLSTTFELEYKKGK